MLRKNKIHTSLTPTFYLLLASPVALTSALTSWQTMERCPIPDATSACFRFPPLSFHISPDVSFLFHHNLPFNLCQACNRLPSIANKNALPEQQILQKKRYRCVICTDILPAEKTIAPIYLHIICVCNQNIFVPLQAKFPKTIASPFFSF